MTATILDELPDHWRKPLEGHLDPSKITTLSAFLTNEYREETVFPPRKDLFNAFRQCSFDSARVLILGQDPYHGEGQANGMSFSVADGVALPPSLRNIYRELVDDPDTPVKAPPVSGDLTSWANQGVLLLNTILSVRAGAALSHRRYGWQHFTDAVIHLLAAEKSGMVFVLWGAPAGKKSRLIEESGHAAGHTILRSTHPSPRSASNNRGRSRAFFGSQPFSKINQALEGGQPPEIDWAIPADR